MALQPLRTLAAFSVSLSFTRSVGLFDGRSAQGRATYIQIVNTEESTHTFIPQVGFEPTIPVFEP
jgi:hypothetical protein